MKNLKILNEFYDKKNNYIIFNDSNIKLIKNIVNTNTSVLYFVDDFNVNDPVYDMFLNKNFNNLILITSKKPNIKRNNRLLSHSKINKEIFSYIKNNILVIIRLSNNYKYMKKVINNLIILKDLLKVSNIKINKTFSNNGINFVVIKDDTSSKYVSDILSSFEIISKDNIVERYEYIYDKVCEYLDCEFSENNFCDFKNNSCIANRNGYSSHSTMGCCYSFEYSKFWDPTFIKNIHVCNHLDCKTCNTKCISCKLFTCEYLNRKNISFNVNNILLLDCFFDKKQLLIIKYNYFKKREEIISKLLEHSNAPLLIYYFTKEYLIN